MPLHQKLKAWQHAQRLAVECVKAARGFPDYEQEALGDQLRRACYSVPLNIAEGSTRRGTREYRRYLDTAWSSLAEVQTALEIARMWDTWTQPSSADWKRSPWRRAKPSTVS